MLDEVSCRKCDNLGFHYRGGGWFWCNPFQVLVLGGLIVSVSYPKVFGDSKTYSLNDIR